MSDLDKYNSMLKEKHGANITVQINSYTEDDGSTMFYYTSAKLGDSNPYATAEEAYDDADLYLCHVGDLW